MNTENEIGVKVPKGQINYNTVAGSLGLAAFAGLGLRNWLGNGNGSVAAGATAVAETQLVLVAGVIYIKAILIIPNPTTGSAGSLIFLFIATYSNTQV